MREDLFRLAAIGVFAGIAGGCATIAPGDYVVFRVGYGESEQSADCWGDGGEPVDQAADSTTFLSGSTFVIFRAADGQYFLDLGGTIIPGTKSGGDYTFTGQTVDVDYFGVDDGSKTTWTGTSNVTLSTSGASVTGRSESSSVQTCDGGDCTEFDEYSCTSSATFVGTIVKDADIDYYL